MNSDNNKKMYRSKAREKIENWLERRKNRLKHLLESKNVLEVRKELYEKELILISNLYKIDKVVV